ncbi:5151_t:CDS:2 [Acaulospora colombiana]|uniref:5151_t:CDS:1 n=1 Tax=Acaulospora colombiana TaxID=27376 RepID=A0ACA9JZG6_9GLOM|nr:5151_t:CDS:2 [Acaulospora colombiana]
MVGFQRDAHTDSKKNIENEKKKSEHSINQQESTGAAILRRK